MNKNKYRLSMLLDKEYLDKMEFIQVSMHGLSKAQLIRNLIDNACEEVEKKHINTKLK